MENSKKSRQKLAAEIDKSLEELRKKKKKNKINLDIANQKVQDYGSSVYTDFKNTNSNACFESSQIMK